MIPSRRCHSGIRSVLPMDLVVCALEPEEGPLSSAPYFPKGLEVIYSVLSEYHHCLAPGKHGLAQSSDTRVCFCLSDVE